jgi:hypothetical protein
MTEADWLAVTAPHPMLDFLRDREISDRKLLRFAVECCRPAQEHFILNESHDAVQLVERFLDGEISAAEYDATRKEFHVADTETECRIHPPREGICEAFFSEAVPGMPLATSAARRPRSSATFLLTSDTRSETTNGSEKYSTYDLKGKLAKLPATPCVTDKSTRCAAWTEAKRPGAWSKTCIAASSRKQSKSTDRW